MYFSQQAYKDAVFISTHKFIGGPQTPGTHFEFINDIQTTYTYGLFDKGILIAKENLFNNDIPDSCGGGTVFFVSNPRLTSFTDAVNIAKYVSI